MIETTANSITRLLEFIPPLDSILVFRPSFMNESHAVYVAKLPENDIFMDELYSALGLMGYRRKEELQENSNSLFLVNPHMVRTANLNFYVDEIAITIYFSKRFYQEGIQLHNETK